MIFILFMLVNLVLIAVQVTISRKSLYKYSFIITIFYTLWVKWMASYVDFIVIGYLICLLFRMMSIACYNMRSRFWQKGENT